MNRSRDRAIDRRSLLRRAGAIGAALIGQALLLPSRARSAPLGTTDLAPTVRALPTLAGREFDLTIDRRPLLVAGRRSQAIAINGTVPGPLLRWREGDTVTLRVHNRLEEATSIHWHGVLLPFQMDGVPGVSFPGIPAGETFEYRFPVRQSGTYWYHSHSNLQEQIGHYGPLIIDPASRDSVVADREVVLVLSDWTFMKPHRLFAELKKMGDSLNYQKRTIVDLARDAREVGLATALGDRAVWGRMRMLPTDIADVTGATYTYLVNGYAPEDRWTALFEPGERVRLRIINASAMSIFNVRIPGLEMEVVQADGLDVQPTAVTELQIGTAETYDVVVTPGADRAWPVLAESIDSSGYALATLAPSADRVAAVPPLRERPLLTMKDMGMSHGGHEEHSELGRGLVPEETGHAAHASPDAGPAPHHHPAGPGVAGLAMEPTSRVGEPGIGLERVAGALTYADLRSLEPNPDLGTPERGMELHLTGNMERYMWSFDGRKFSPVVGPILFYHGERLRLVMVNDTMMPHPIHLHGMFFELVVPGREDDDHKLRKHTVVVKPGERLAIDVTADAPGDWAFHCHLLYHMHAGMFRVVSVRDREAGDVPSAGDSAPAGSRTHDAHGEHHHHNGADRGGSTSEDLPREAPPP